MRAGSNTPFITWQFLEIFAICLGVPILLAVIAPILLDRLYIWRLRRQLRRYRRD